MSDLLDRPRNTAPALAAIEAFIDDAIAIRHDLHHHPELSRQEHRTAALVADRLREWGYEVTTGIGGNGVVGTLRRGNGTRALGIRADMDALPIAEASQLDFASNAPGVMHACGHDGHTAILLAAARYLAENGNFSGTLHLIFQPAEEIGQGAKAMIDDGLFERFPSMPSMACTIGRACPLDASALSMGPPWPRSTGSASASRARAGTVRRLRRPSIRCWLQPIWSPLCRVLWRAMWRRSIPPW
jgi:metal-dependent amidase/aminoacylase/carboxypeptidase family protein